MSDNGLSAALRGIARVGLLTLAVAGTGVAARSVSHIDTPDELARGRADGMAVTERGVLFVAPRVVALGGTDAVQVWSIAARRGTLYLGTGPDGRILALDPPAGSVTLQAVEQPLVTALAFGPDGSLLAGTAPDGLVYRIELDGRAEVWSTTGERYVWALAVGPDDRLFAGSGESGRILEILPTGATELFFDGDEAHIVSLVALPDGSLLAGGAGRGLIYRIDPEGHALVLHDDELPEVVDLATTTDGGVYAAIVAAPEIGTSRPILRMNLPDGVEVGAADENLGAFEERTGPTLRGVIEGFPRAVTPSQPRTRGRVVRIDPDGAVTEIWHSTTEAPFCLALDDSGRLLFGTGEPARLYRVEADGDVALLATMSEGQVTALEPVDGSLFLATSNPAAVYRVDETPSETAVFISLPLDAGGPSRWGAIRWRLDGPPGQTEFYTRSGNSVDPDVTWSGWSPALTDGAGSAIVNPDGRYLQWRIRQQTARAGEARRVSAVTVDYERYNRPPSIRDFRIEGATEGGGSVQFRWGTADPDGDRVDVEVGYRLRDESEWRIAALLQHETDVAEDSEIPGDFLWEAGGLAEGHYLVRASATDQPGHPPGEGLTAEPGPELPVVLDRTPPRMEIVRDESGAVRVHLEDRHSRIRSLEILQGERVHYSARPVDGVNDSSEEDYVLRLPAAPSGSWTVRGVDAAGNAVSRSLPVE